MPAAAANARQIGPGSLAHDQRMAELARDSRAVREAELLEQMVKMFEEFEANAARKKRVHAPHSGGGRVVPTRSKRRIDDADGDNLKAEAHMTRKAAHHTRGGDVLAVTPFRRIFAIPASQLHSGSSPPRV